jgi:hypothetical protein
MHPRNSGISLSSGAWPFSPKTVDFRVTGGMIGVMAADRLERLARVAGRDR